MAVKFHVVTGDHIPSGLLQFLNGNFRYQLSRDELYHLLRGSSTTKSRIHTATNAGQIIAVYIVLEAVALYDGRERKLGFASYMAISKSSRSPSLFIEFSKNVFESEAKRGVEALFGPPNANGYIAHKGLAGWRDFAVVKELVYYPGPHFGQTFPVSVSPKFTAEHLALARSVKDPIRFKMSRSLEWFEWRYLRFPQRKYQIFSCYRHGTLEAFAVVKDWPDGEQGVVRHIMEIHAVDQESHKLMLAAIAHNGENLHKLNVWCDENDPLFDSYISFGFTAQKDQPLIFKSLVSDNSYALSGPASFFFGDADGF